MKILRITVQGLPLFKEDLDICFYAQQRVSEDDKNNLYNMIENYYLHSACAFIGINASGKTSVLKSGQLSIKHYKKNEPINHAETKSILGGAKKKTTICTYFYDKRNMFAVWRLKLLQRNRRQENICIRFYLKNYGKSQLLALDQRNI